MVQLILIGVSAGAATALLFATVASGTPLSVLLFYLAPLPILIVAMGWTHWAALIAAFTASIALAIGFGPFLFLAFLLGIGLPAWWLGYLVLLARPATTPGALEWYPVGHIVFWAAVVSALVVIAAMLNLGADEENFRNALRSGIERLLHARGAGAEQPIGVDNSNRLLDLMVSLLPMVAAVVTTITNAINLGIAARVVMMSGRLRRPWPEFAAMRFPSYAPAVTGAAVACFLLPGLVGIASGAMMASLLTAYAILGFAVVHSITRGMAMRPFVLGGVYTVIVLFWPVAIGLILLGLADTAFDLRGRVAGKRNLPTPRN